MHTHSVPGSVARLFYNAIIATCPHLPFEDFLRGFFCRVSSQTSNLEWIPSAPCSPSPDLPPEIFTKRLIHGFHLLPSPIHILLSRIHDFVQSDASPRSVWLPEALMGGSCMDGALACRPALTSLYRQVLARLSQFPNFSLPTFGNPSRRSPSAVRSPPLPPPPRAHLCAPRLSSPPAPLPVPPRRPTSFPSYLPYPSPHPHG